MLKKPGFITLNLSYLLSTTKILNSCFNFKSRPFVVPYGRPLDVSPRQRTLPRRRKWRRRTLQDASYVIDAPAEFTGADVTAEVVPWRIKTLHSRNITETLKYTPLPLPDTVHLWEYQTNQVWDSTTTLQLVIPLNICLNKKGKREWNSQYTN